MTTSLIISTYNSPKYLSLCLKSLLNQNHMPNEVLIADDGSGVETKNIIDSFREVSPITIKHIWHPDNGFRLSAIRNKAIEAASGDYIIQIDGDIIMHPHFIDDHIKYAKPGHYVGASRVFINPTFSQRILNGENFDYKDLIKHCKRKFASQRIPLLTHLFRHSNSSSPMAIHGCNMAYWKGDAIIVNGYNEDIHGWGREDSEFAIRLSNLGLKKRWIKFSAIAYHIYHKEASRDSLKANDTIMVEASRSKSTYTPNGIRKCNT